MPTTALLEPQQISEVLHHWKSSDPRFSHALDTGISQPTALARLAIRLCIQDRYPDALTVLRAAVALSPNDPNLLSNLAVVLERTDQTDEAILTVQKSLALSPNQTDSWIFLGNLKSKRSDPNGAQRAYETALALQPNSPLALQGLALLQQSQRQYPQAIQSLLACLKLNHINAPLLSILGQLYYQSNQFEKARDAYTAAVEYDPQNSLYQQMLRKTTFITAALLTNSLDDAIAAFLNDPSASPENNNQDLQKILQTTFALLTATGHTDAAQRLGQKRLALFPNSPSASYLLEALAGNPSITRSPDAYLIEYFDAFADKFDHHLTTTLAYDIPQKLANILTQLLPKNSHPHILDAGCGTGLSAPHLRPLASILTGVDLSPRMLHHAHNRHLYDHLHQAELTHFLQNSPNQFDVILAADVLIYFGNLTPLAHALAHALRPNGLLLFSIEHTHHHPHHLQPSGRFAHNPNHIHHTFSQHFSPKLTHQTTLRLEATLPVPGTLFALQRKPGEPVA